MWSYPTRGHQPPLSNVEFGSGALELVSSSRPGDSTQGSASEDGILSSNGQSIGSEDSSIGLIPGELSHLVFAQRPQRGREGVRARHHANIGPIQNLFGARPRSQGQEELRVTERSPSSRALPLICHRRPPCRANLRNVSARLVRYGLHRRRWLWWDW